MRMFPKNRDGRVIWRFSRWWYGVTPRFHTGKIPSLHPWKMVVGRLFSFWNGPLSGDMLIFKNFQGGRFHRSFFCSGTCFVWFGFRISFSQGMIITNGQSDSIEISFNRMILEELWLRGKEHKGYKGNDQFLCCFPTPNSFFESNLAGGRPFIMII